MLIPLKSFAWRGRNVIPFTRVISKKACTGAEFASLCDIQNALDRSELVPCFQPIVELRTGQLAGFEVLTRWQHLEHGLILPQNFISMAERHGLIGCLMYQVVSKAFRSAPLLPDPLMLAFNVSPFQLHDLSLPGQIRDLAERARFPMERLHVEITESALVDNIDVAKIITAELKAMGCKLAMDDFGTGYSSLRHLQGLPFDKLKVDRSFVASMMEERESRKIVAAIIGLGHSLGLITVAEGVETEEQADMLQLLGCEMGQGWLYGEPMPAESIRGIVAAAPHTILSRSAKWGTKDAVSGLEAVPTQHLAQLQAIYDGAPVGVCFLDPNLRYISLNGRIAEMNGAPVAAHIGKTVEEMFPELYPRIKSHLLRALKGEAIAGVEAHFQDHYWGKPDRTILVSYQPAFDETGDVIGISLTALETTQWGRVELRRNAVSGSLSRVAVPDINTSRK
jgi:EAL domain-containing protein (putative c-di-GMP-specific phosphodiesterase class I)